MLNLHTAVPCIPGHRWWHRDCRSVQKQPDLKKLDAYIADAVVKFDQPGLAVGIVKDGKLIFQKGYGKLDLAKPDPVTANSVFYCASFSKAFTACSIGLLVDEGKLGCDDTVVSGHALVQRDRPLRDGEHFRA